MSAALPTAVLQLARRLDAGEVGRDTLDLARYLRSRGCRSFVASGGGALLRELAAAGVTHLPLPGDGESRLARWLRSTRLVRQIRQHRVGLIHAQSAGLAPAAAAAARAAGVPLVVTVREAAPSRSALDALALADRLIAVSEFVAEDISARLPPAGGKQSVVHRWVDLAEFDPERVRGHRVQALAERWGIGPGVGVVLVPPLPAGDRGHLLLLQAMARTVRTDVAALLLGGPDTDTREGAELVAAVRRSGLGERVRFASGADDLPAALALADVVVVPATTPDPSGFLAAAAQAMGRPVIVTHRGALAEAVLPASTGWLVPADDAGELARALELALALDADTRRRLGARARAFVAETFGMAANADRILAVYRELSGPPLARAG